MTHDPYHDGERTVQAMAGEEAMAARTGAVIGGRIPPRAIPFLREQSVLLVASMDLDGDPWPSRLRATPGFLRPSEDGAHLDVDLTEVDRDERDVLWEHLRTDPHVGTLAIDLETRRRVRVNGRLVRDTPDRLTIEVDEAYPNCPKYIQRRTPKDLAPIGTADQVVTGASLDALADAIIERADTAFVATVNGAGSADLSHRGGAPGFIQRRPSGALRIPDFAGNGMFNTLGNIHAYPRAGLLILDDATGQALQLVGHASLHFDTPDPENRTGGTGRFWQLQPEAVRRWTIAPPNAWTFLDASPFNPPA